MFTSSIRRLLISVLMVSAISTSLYASGAPKTKNLSVNFQPEIPRKEYTNQKRTHRNINNNALCKIIKKGVPGMLALTLQSPERRLDMSTSELVSILTKEDDTIQKKCKDIIFDITLLLNTIQPVAFAPDSLPKAKGDKR